MEAHAHSDDAAMPASAAVTHKAAELVAAAAREATAAAALSDAPAELQVPSATSGSAPPPMSHLIAVEASTGSSREPEFATPADAVPRSRRTSTINSTRATLSLQAWQKEHAVEEREGALRLRQERKGTRLAITRPARPPGKFVASRKSQPVQKPASQPSTVSSAVALDPTRQEHADPPESRAPYLAELVPGRPRTHAISIAPQLLAPVSLQVTSLPTASRRQHAHFPACPCCACLSGSLAACAQPVKQL